tara:strand:+ start:517 stop:678 length:162 start_codon:yes stop_codon:yes gene_type:complete
MLRRAWRAGMFEKEKDEAAAQFQLSARAYLDSKRAAAAEKNPTCPARRTNELP